MDKSKIITDVARIIGDCFDAIPSVAMGVAEQVMSAIENQPRSELPVGGFQSLNFQVGPEDAIAGVSIIHTKEGTHVFLRPGAVRGS